MAVGSGLSLSTLPVGRKGLVVTVGVEGLVRRRLLDLGLVPGTVVESIRRSPAGDPTAFQIRGAVIALRIEEGNKVAVQPL